MKELETINQAIRDLAEKALRNSQTYQEALNYIDKNCYWNDLGQAIKKAAQDMIRARALNSQIS